MILFGKDVLNWMPNAYVQFVRFDGPGLDSDVVSQRRFEGDLFTVLRDLTAFVRVIVKSRPARVSEIQEVDVFDYPEIAIREFLMNAVLHRSYEAPAPIRLDQYTDRIEIQNPGPLYGLARPDNFPTQTSYRNPVLAEAMKTLGAVNRFGRGVQRAQAALAKNGSPPAEFAFGDLHFGVTVRGRA
jgi:ATP-dependent DNA helicase RecG